VVSFIFTQCLTIRVIYWNNSLSWDAGFCLIFPEIFQLKLWVDFLGRALETTVERSLILN